MQQGGGLSPSHNYLKKVLGAYTTLSQMDSEYGSDILREDSWGLAHLLESPDVLAFPLFGD
jgi:hypothetical protein